MTIAEMYEEMSLQTDEDLDDIDDREDCIIELDYTTQD